MSIPTDNANIDAFSAAGPSLPIATTRRSTNKRNLIERVFDRLKDFRRIATRYVKRDNSFLSAILLAVASLGGPIESKKVV